MPPLDLPPDVDLAWHDPELEHAVRALAVGDLTPALDLLVVTRDQADRRELCVRVLGEASSVMLPELRAAVEQRRDDADRLLLLGSALTAAAWNARGTALAEHTTETQFGGLIDLTQQARGALRRAGKLAPEDPAPWSALMHCALGAPEHDNEGDEVFAEVLRRAPHLFDANTVRLQMLAGKWYGSEEQMFEFARARTADLPSGHPLLALIPSAYIEVHLANMTEGNIVKRMWKAMTYLGKQHVRDEVNAASVRLLENYEAYQGHPRSMTAHQIFACFYRKSGHVADKARLVAHIARSGERASSWPWGYFGDHAEQFGGARRAAATDG